jgi:sugar (pentulose or hexulose) kinase
MTAPLLLGVDIGTQGSKGVVADLRGQVLAQHFCEHPVLHPRPGWAEHDMEQTWWGDFVKITRALLAQPGIEPHAIAAICVSGLYPNMAPTDADGQPLRNAILYSDNRAVEEIEYVNQRYGLQLTSEEIIPKLLWFMRHEPDLFAQTRMFFNAHSYVVYKLTGQYTIDYIAACLIGAIYATSRAGWREDVCQEIGIPLDILPTPCPPAQVVGEVTRAAAEQTGLIQGTPILTGSGDVYFSLLASGVVGPGDVAIYYGTAGLTTVCYSSLEFLAREPYPIDDGYCFFYPAYMLTSGELVRWFRDQFGVCETEVAKWLDRSAYQLLDEEASHIQPGCDGLILLPYFLGQRSPVFDPLAKGVFFGMSMSHTRAHLYRAILESYGYGIRHGLEEASRSQDIEINRLIATGGGAQSPLWRQIVSDIVGVSQDYVARADAPLGDAYLAGYGVGLFPSFETLRQEWLEVTSVTQPRMDIHRLYQPFYEIYKDLHGALRSQFVALDRALDEASD